jgi:hypothetical protein
MEPNNFDKNIQQKFNSREIEPSAKAWDRLDAMLTVAEEKKQPVVSYFWLKIAASFLLFSGMGYVFFQQNQKSEISQPTNEVVITKETPTNEIENNDDAAIIISPDTPNELAIATPKTTNSVAKKVSKQNDNSEYKSKLDSYLAIPEIQNEIIANTENNNQQKEQTNQKPTYNYVNPETLLAEVQGNKKPKGNTNTYKSTLKVNPNDLLNSVESELDQSFKDKALTKFKQAKSVIVNRNYN